MVKDGKNITRFFILLVLTLGLLVGVILVQQRQIIRKKAAEDIYGAFEVKDPGGNPLLCSGNTCQTNTTTVKIRVLDLERLLSD